MTAELSTFDARDQIVNNGEKRIIVMPDSSPPLPAPPDATASLDAEIVAAIEDPMVRLTRQLVIWTRVMALAAALTLVASWFQWSAMNGQLEQMKGASKDTQQLVDAAKKQATALEHAKDAALAQATAARAQAASMNSLRAAGETQAEASRNLADAGLSQAAATRSLAIGASQQLAALQETAVATKAQADAALVSSQSTDRLAAAGQSQAAAVLQSLGLAREANEISRESGIAADRPWLGLQFVGPENPQVGQDWVVRAQLVNTGKTPALNVTVQFEISLSPLPFSRPPAEECKSDCQTNIVFPGSNWGYSPKISGSEITKDVVDSVGLGKTTMIVRSVINYFDVHGGRHQTRFCGYYIKSASGLTTCTGGNAAS